MSALEKSSIGKFQLFGIHIHAESRNDKVIRKLLLRVSALLKHLWIAIRNLMIYKEAELKTNLGCYGASTYNELMKILCDQNGKAVRLFLVRFE